MRTLLLLFLGTLLGIIGTLMFFTIDNPYDSTGIEGPGGGSARLSFGEDHLASIIAEQLREMGLFGPEANVGVRVHAHGLVDVNIGVGAAPVGSTISLSLDPEIIDGRLEVVVAQAQVGGLIAPREIARVVEVQLQEQLESLATGFEYRLTSIMTTERRLTLEIQI
jgi:hypothetical protein